MPGVVQTTFDFLLNGYGWSEAYYKDTGSASLKAFYQTSALPLAQKRALMLGKQASLDAISCSFVVDKQDSYLRYEFLPGVQTVNAAQAHETIYTIMRANGATKRKAVYIRGQQDDAIDNGGNFIPSAQPFVQNGTIFFDALIQGSWGWMTGTKSPAHSIINYAVDIDGFIEFTVAGAMFPAPGDVPVFERVRILFKGKKSRLNGLHTVRVLSPTTFQSLKPMAVFPFTIPGSATKYTYGFIAADDWNFQKAGERRAGRPKLHTRGRASAEALG